MFTFVPTLLLGSLLQYVEGRSNATAEQAWYYVAFLFLASILASVAESRAIWIGQKIGFRLRSIMISEVYAKALRRRMAPSTSKGRPGVRKTAKQKSFMQRLRAWFGKSSQADEQEETSPLIEKPSQADIGTIMNLFTTDASKIADAGANMHQVWGSVPVQIIVAITLLYFTLGLSAFAGVALMAAMVPLNSRIAQRFGAIQMEIMAASDGRIQSTTEMVRSIRIIKLFAWESHFEQSIGEKRAAELRALHSRYILWSFAATIWYGIPPLITFSSLLFYAAVERKSLTPSLAFTSLLLFSLLKMPLDDFVGMLARVQDSLVSVRRVEKFLQEGETDKYEQLSQKRPNDALEIGFEHATFTWGHKDEDNADDLSDDGVSDSGYDFTLRDLNLKFEVGKLSIITGATGSGKSSMLLALLGEMTLVKGAVRMPAAVHRESLSADPETGLINAVAYCAQEAWLINDTVRNNILFSSPYKEERYKAVLDACALGFDLKTLVQGDLTRVGERGVSLSGGQKQRIALARAVYSNAYHLLLDDCLSAVDSHTATWIFQQCIRAPLVKGRTCILVTHNVALAAADADYLVTLDNGSVIAAGTPSDLADSGLLPEFEGITTRKTNKQGNQRDLQDSAFSLQTSVRPEQIKKEEQEESQQQETDGSDEDPLASDETQYNGKIPWRNVWRYLAAMGGWRFWPLLAFSFVAQQFGSIATNWWVRELSNAYVRAGTHATDDHSAGASFNISSSDHLGSAQDVNVGYFFGMYALIIGVYLIVGLMRMLLVSFGSLAASAQIHQQLMRSIMNATFKFFDDTSFGQIINRVSRDLQTVDQDLAVLAVATLHFLGALAGIIILIAIITPAFLGPGVFISVAYYLIGVIYITASRYLKVIESTQRTPLFQHLGETISGITTIRAYGAVGQYSTRNLVRIDKANRPSFFLAATERWLALRLGLMGAFVSLFAGVFAVLSVGKLSAGAIGLSLSYAIVFSEHVLWLVRYHTANLQNMTAYAPHSCFSLMLYLVLTLFSQVATRSRVYRRGTGSTGSYGHCEPTGKLAWFRIGRV